MDLPLTTFADLFAKREEVKIQEQQQDRTAELSKAEEEAVKLHLAGQQANLAALQEAGVWTEKRMPDTLTPDGQYLRGYIDETGNPTESGELFVELLESGIFDEAGNLTKKGEAFAMDRTDALASDRREAYKLRKQSGLDTEPDQSFGEMLGGAAGVVGDILKGIGKTATAPFRVMGDATIAGEAADYLIRSQTAVESALEGPATLGAGVDLTLDKLAAGATGSDEYYWQELQAYDRFKQDLDDADAAKLTGVLGIADESVQRTLRTAANALSEDPEQAAKEGAAMGIILDPSNAATMGVGFGAAKLPWLARMGRVADDAMEAGLAAQQGTLKAAQAKRSLDMAKFYGRAAQNEAKTLEAAGKITESKAMFGRAAEMLRQADTLATQLPELEASATARTQWAAKVLQDAGAAPDIMAGVEQARALGRSMRAAPARAIAPVLDRIGSGLIAADSKLGPMLDRFSKLRTGAAWLGVATGNPLLAAPEVARKAIAAGPAIRGIGNFTRILGNQLMEAQGSVPFWQKVKQAESATPLMRAVAGGMDNLTLGGKVSIPFRRAAAVPGALAVAAPMNIGFQGLAKGGDFGAETFKEGLAQSLIFDGGAAMAGALTGGKLNDLRAKHAGDELNFRKRLSPDQSPLYGRMNAGARKNMAAYSAAFPELRFKLTESGPSAFDRGTNTAVINVNGDKLRPLIAHEVNHYIQVKGQIEDGVVGMLLGDDANGGMFRAKDGTLDPHFRAAMDAYNRRMADSGLKPVDVRDFAVEYFTEAAVDHLMGAADSGRLGKFTGRSGFERTMAKVIETTIPKLPILRDLFFRLGGAIDQRGKMVEGNGLLAGGIREIPGAKKMIEAILAEQAGRKTNGRPAAEPVSVDLKDIAPDAAFSAFDTDQAGKVVTENGKPKPLPVVKDKARAEVGKKAVAEIEKTAMAEESGAALEPLDPDPITREEAATETPEQRSKRVKRTEKGSYAGTHLSPREMQAIRKSGVLNDLQFSVLRMLNRSSRDMTGDVFSMIYHPAIETSGGGKKTYATKPAQLRDVVPFGIKINKAGGLYVELLNVTYLARNVAKMASTEKGNKLYGGDTQKIMADVEGVLAAFREGRYSDAYLQARYGEKWKEYRNFLNSLMNTLTNEQRAANPNVEPLGKQENKVVESFRIDRISKTAKTNSGQSLPFSYQDVKLNHFPSGVPEPVEP